MKYLLIGEKYDRGPSTPLKIRFEAEDDTTAKLKMCVITFAENPKKVYSLNTYDEITSYFLHEVIDEYDMDNIYDALESDVNNPEAFTSFVLDDLFVPANGDGMDYFSSLENITTREKVWVDDKVTM